MTFEYQGNASESDQRAIFGHPPVLVVEESNCLGGFDCKCKGAGQLRVVDDGSPQAKPKGNKQDISTKDTRAGRSKQRAKPQEAASGGSSKAANHSVLHQTGWAAMQRATPAKHSSIIQQQLPRAEDHMPHLLMEKSILIGVH